jgi:hypothetical protein
MSSSLASSTSPALILSQVAHAWALCHSSTALNSARSSSSLRCSSMKIRAAVATLRRRLFAWTASLRRSFAESWTLNGPTRAAAVDFTTTLIYQRQVLARGQPGSGLEQRARPNVMPAKNARVHVVLERSVYDALGQLARRRGTSLSTTARDLLRDALVKHEDLALAEIAKERERTFVRSVGLTHHDVWRGRRIKED